MACNNVYKDYINCGVDDIVIDAGLTQGEVYKIVISTPQLSIYQFPLTADVFGDLTLSVSSLPNGMLNPYAGPFTLSIGTSCDPFLFCDFYKYIQFDVVNGNQAKNTLSCCAPGSTSPSATCCTTETVIFNNEAVTVIPYTGAAPLIEVAYLNIDGTYTISGISTTVILNEVTKEFTIDHGVIASGKVKLLK